MKKEVLFRTAISGFNKEDVNSFIEAQSRQAEEEIGRLKAEMESLNERLTNFIKTSASYQDELSRRCSEYDLLKESNDKLSAQHAELQRDFEKLRAEKELLLDENNRLQDKLDAMTSMHDESQGKVNQFENLKSSIADILLEAHQNAESILEAAKAEACHIRKNNEMTVDSLRKSIGQIRDDASLPIRKMDQVLGIMKTGFEDFEKALSDLEKTIEVKLENSEQNSSPNTVGVLGEKGKPLTERELATDVGPFRFRAENQ